MKTLLPKLGNSNLLAVPAASLVKFVSSVPLFCDFQLPSMLPCQ